MSALVHIAEGTEGLMRIHIPSKALRGFELKLDFNIIAALLLLRWPELGNGL